MKLRVVGGGREYLAQNNHHTHIFVLSKEGPSFVSDVGLFLSRVRRCCGSPCLGQSQNFPVSGQNLTSQMCGSMEDIVPARALCHCS